MDHQRSFESLNEYIKQNTIRNPHKNLFPVKKNTNQQGKLPTGNGVNGGHEALHNTKPVVDDLQNFIKHKLSWHKIVNNWA